MIQHLSRKIIFLLLFCFIPYANAIDVPIYDFSLDPYPQAVENYLPVHPEKDQTPLVSKEYQRKQIENLFRHYFANDDSSLSPWGARMIEALLPHVLIHEQSILSEFDNSLQDTAHQHYAENFKKHPVNWLSHIKSNMNLSKLSQSRYDESHRAITVHNTHARALPESAPDFYHFSLAGEGFPFDNLQLSSLYVGTPLYVLQLTDDQAWALVLTPHAFVGWVQTKDIAYVTPDFVQTWQKYLQKDTRVVSKLAISMTVPNTLYQITAYLGALFPLASETEQSVSLYVPAKGNDGFAKLKILSAPKEGISAFPMPLQVANIRKLLSQMHSQPYGWGGAYFYNDCSSELQHLFTAFGLWLPRNSAQQAALMPAVVDLKDRAVEERIQFLKAEADPLLTIIYIGGHVMLYLGENQQGAFAGEPMTYQNVWGLSPESRDKRYVIGQSVFLPLLKQFPEQRDIQSQAARKAFSLVFLRRLVSDESPEVFVNRFF